MLFNSTQFLLYASFWVIPLRLNSDAGELPWRKHTTFRKRRKFEIKNRFLFINPLNAEFNPMYHLLILLGDLTLMGKCIISISNKIIRYTVYLYLETALHVSGGTSTHHQELIQLYLQHLVFVTALLLSAAIVDELEPVWVCCEWRTPVSIYKLTV
jgi:hypothetical protein